MWKYTPTGATIREGKAWTDVDGIQHPANWYVWSLERKTEMGLVEIVYETPPDSRLYHWSQNPDGTITKTAKALDDVATEDSERPTRGVKFTQIALVKTQQGSILAQTDWAYTRFADIGVAVPAEIKTYRDAVRAAAAAQVAAINGATTIEEMATVLASEVMQWPIGPSANSA